MTVSKGFSLGKGLRGYAITTGDLSSNGLRKPAPAIAANAERQRVLDLLYERLREGSTPATSPAPATSEQH